MNHIKPILILGGYGGTGKGVTRLLLQETKCPVIIAGRNLAKATALAKQLNDELKINRVSAVFADAANPESLAHAFQGIKMVVVASSTADYAPNVARAALEANADYLDYHFNEKILSLLSPFEESIKKSGRIFITQAGFHPGLPATFARAAAPYFDHYHKAIIGMAMAAKFESVDSTYELIDSIGNFHADIYINGHWRRATFKDMRMLDFGRIFGKQKCFPIQMDEIKALPAMLHLEEIGVYVAGFDWFTNYITMPLIMLAYKIKKGFLRHNLAQLFVWGTNKFPSKAMGVAFLLEADGTKGGKPIHVSIFAEHEDPYKFTAIPVIACILQYLDGTLSKPGLSLMGHCVDPKRLLKDMERMGIKVEWNFT